MTVIEQPSPLPVGDSFESLPEHVYFVVGPRPHTGPTIPVSSTTKRIYLKLSNMSNGAFQLDEGVTVFHKASHFEGVICRRIQIKQLTFQERNR